MKHLLKKFYNRMFCMYLYVKKHLYVKKKNYFLSKYI